VIVIIDWFQNLAYSGRRWWDPRKTDDDEKEVRISYILRAIKIKTTSTY